MQLVSLKNVCVVACYTSVTIVLQVLNSKLNEESDCIDCCKCIVMHVVCSCDDCILALQNGFNAVVRSG